MDAPAPESDLQLVARLQKGDKTAFREIVRRHQDKVYRLALRLTRDEARAQDAMQDAFLQVYRKIDQFQEHSAFTTWLYRITVNAALDHRRRRRSDALMDEIPAGLSDTGPSPHQRAVEAQRSDLLKEALQRIPEHYRVPLVLCHVEGLPVEEVARVLDLPEGTVKSRLFRARAILKETIRRHYPALMPAIPGEAS